MSPATFGATGLWMAGALELVALVTWLLSAWVTPRQ